MDNYSICNSVIFTDASAKMGSNVIGDHKIHLNMAMKTIEGDLMVGSLLF